MASKKRLIWDEDVYRRLVDLAEKRGSVAIPFHRIAQILFDESPTVDAVEVVRCKDCTMAKNSEYNRIVWCTKHQCRKLYFDFCSKGERTQEPVYMRGAKMDGDN